MRARLSSPRFRRRAGRVTALAGLAGGVVALVALWPDARREPEVFSNRPATVVAQPKRVTLSPADRQAALRTANLFVQTAVRRERVARSFELAHPTLREGYTRSRWASGDIPVVPFPVDYARFRFDYAYEGLVGWKVSVYPKAGSGLRPMLFYLDLRRERGRPWLVSSWSPSPTDGGPPAAGGGDGSGFAIDQRAEAADEGRVSPAWLAVPFALLGLALAGVGGIWLRDWRRGVRAERDYYSSSSSPS